MPKARKNTSGQIGVLNGWNCGGSCWQRWKVFGRGRMMGQSTVPRQISRLRPNRQILPPKASLLKQRRSFRNRKTTIYIVSAEMMEERTIPRRRRPRFTRKLTRQPRQPLPRNLARRKILHQPAMIILPRRRRPKCPNHENHERLWAMQIHDQEKSNSKIPRNPHRYPYQLPVSRKSQIWWGLPSHHPISVFPSHRRQPKTEIMKLFPRRM